MVVKELILLAALCNPSLELRPAKLWYSIPVHPKFPEQVALAARAPVIQIPFMLWQSYFIIPGRTQAYAIVQNSPPRAFPTSVLLNSCGAVVG
ncbi:hypothetical protein A2943_01860 [Candidatus Adlerbacteria bacterium RIFCSPLOWO2_01_FULL_51_16]|uniref:Uncharacterized protein n=1 Tax=Candidatus Adlerbacteria bacterium RIFCSPLOWO2_01_FULL_51_16 TaxID=1797243 RepID=A0A1F4XFQ6_9BACT|nr:MAG: hypothetical protein A2943_01860 [Candidatus Adlerbacteria bacterium RIFCSPLOWO2_01_FULL_51_16]